MRMRRWHLGLLSVGAAALGSMATFGTASYAQSTPCEFTGVERVVAIGDVHGAYDRFAEILRVSGLVDSGMHWAGGTAHLVQLGDIDDRGADSRKALDLLRRLEGEASKAGG